MYTDAEHFPFLQGVASGDPLHDSVLLWTRVDSGSGASENVEWALWDPADPAQSLQNPLKSGSVDTDGSRDFTVNIQVSGLSAGHAYVYQFKDSAGRVSVVGKTRTAAAESEQARVAVLSCTSAWNGYMNYYRHIGNRNDLDAVIHLGDYIYPQNSELERFPLGMCNHEWWRSANYFGKDNGYNPEDNPEPALENWSRKFNCDGSMLEQYRRIYEYYHLDPDFRLARQNHPFIVVLDNHDAEADTPLYNGALQAAMEWTPMRHRLYNSSSGEAYLDMKREFTLGKDLVHLIAIDTRRKTKLVYSAQRKQSGSTPSSRTLQTNNSE